jgi:hypothetical protein
MRKNTLIRKYTVAFAALVITAIFLGCVATPDAPMTSEQMASQGVDETALRRGRALATTECAGCHRFYWPHEYSPEQWPRIIGKMGKRASLSSSQAEDVSLYFVTTSRAMQNK